MVRPVIKRIFAIKTKDNTDKQTFVFTSSIPLAFDDNREDNTNKIGNYSGRTFAEQ